MSNTVLIGSDPELFVSRSGTISSAIGKIGGTKNEPRPVNYGALQEDNVLLEFNIAPAATLAEFQHNLQAVMHQAADSIQQYRLEIVQSLSSHVYGMDELESFGDAAFIFGCEPDFNAWTGMQNWMPTEVDPGLRTAGGHIHIGYSHLHKVTHGESARIIQMCDILLGVPSLLIDKDDRRRQLYGKAGATRFKSYGPEYRTLSNFWVFSDELQAWAYHNAIQAYDKRNEVEAYCDAVGGADEVQRIINENDKVAAKRVVDALGLQVA